MALIGNGVIMAKCRVLVGSLARATRFTSNLASDVSEESIRKSVFISQSTDIYTNLALEDWFYRNYDFTNHHVLLLWRNEPCVVIGRHQNPWMECNVHSVEKNGISLARRNSGGGTVYHDMGNLNLSFFTPRERYDRRYNLDVISNALYREWSLKTDINAREDIVVDNTFKDDLRQVSGTAAKLGRPNAYHHCTLLVDVNKSDLSLALERKENGITTNATESTRSPIKNLTDLNHQIQPNKLLSAIGWEYLRTKALVPEDGGENLIQKQKGFQMINPTKDWFPGIEKLKDEFGSWQWIYGKTPKFTVTRILEVPSQNSQVHRLKLTIEVQNGIVEEIKVNLPTGFVHTDFSQDASVITNLRGSRYTREITESIITAIGLKTVAQNASRSIDKSNIAASQ